MCVREIHCKASSWGAWAWFRIQGFGFGVWGLGFEVQGLLFRVWGLGFGLRVGPEAVERDTMVEMVHVVVLNRLRRGGNSSRK